MATLESGSNNILKIYNSRKIILQQMENLNFDVEEYSGFSTNEVDAMYKNSQLDMLIQHKTESKKVYIKYYLSSNEIQKTPNTHVKNTRQISKNTLSQIVEDLYEIDNILTHEDSLIVIIEEEPNDTILNTVKYMYEKNKVFIVIHNIRRLQFDILKHELVPSQCDILNEKDTEELMKMFNIDSLKQLPEISRFDPVSLAILLRPKQIVRFTRKSPTAFNSVYYRVCV